MIKTIIGFIGCIALFSVGSNGAAEYRNYRGETLQQSFERSRQEQRMKRLEQRQQRLERRQRGGYL